MGYSDGLETEKDRERKKEGERAREREKDRENDWSIVALHLAVMQCSLSFQCSSVGTWRRALLNSHTRRAASKHRSMTHLALDLALAQALRAHGPRDYHFFSQGSTPLKTRSQLVASRGPASQLVSVLEGHRCRARFLFQRK